MVETFFLSMLPWAKKLGKERQAMRHRLEESKAHDATLSTTEVQELNLPPWSETYTGIKSWVDSKNDPAIKLLTRARYNDSVDYQVVDILYGKTDQPIDRLTFVTKFRRPNQTGAYTLPYKHNFKLTEEIVASMDKGYEYAKNKYEQSSALEFNFDVNVQYILDKTKDLMIKAGVWNEDINRQMRTQNSHSEIDDPIEGKYRNVRILIGDRELTRRSVISNRSKVLVPFSDYYFIKGSERAEKKLEQALISDIQTYVFATQGFEASEEALNKMLGRRSLQEILAENKAQLSS